MQIPPEVARYLKGRTPETRQFDFLIGEWQVAGTRYKPDGSLLMNYRAIWVAQHLNEGRMVMDDFKALAPTGEVVSSFVTLRTYSEATARWEMQGLAALQPAMPAEWHGQWTGREMHLQALGKTAQGVSIRTKIRFFDIQPQQFAWESTWSADDGATWARGASLNAVRVSS
jgi:hypothetical protein